MTAPSPGAARVTVTVLLATAIAAAAPGHLTAQAADAANEARVALHSGEYDTAIDGFRTALRSEPANVQARLGLIEALVSTGEYEEAVTAGQSAPNTAAVGHATGRALLRLGRLDEAAQAFREAAASGGRYALAAEADLAELLFDRGRIDEAMERFDRFIDVYNGADGNLRAPDLVAVGRAVRYLGRTEPILFQDAIKALVEAQTSDPTDFESYIHQGNLYLEKYDSPSSKTYFQEVLAQNPNHPEALLGMAKSLIFDGSREAQGMLDRLLEIDPNHVEARALTAMRHLTNERHAEAQEIAEAALETNPVSLSALTALAGAHLIAGNTAAFEATRRRALEVNPAYAGFGIALAELSVQTRRYAQAVQQAGEAVALDSLAWEGWGIMGMNQLRLGDIEAGRANIERAFEGDPYNPWFKNNLDLLDTFGGYEPKETEHFELFLHGSESELLATYLAPIAEEAFDSLSRRYGDEPDLPVRAELFPSHADFSVRTLGEAGLGALGVSFGRVLVMDSPSAREVGDYNWASVFWHELAHTFHLAISDNRVPRWFSEGLAVHEQRQAREGWGHQPNIGFLQALLEGRLKKVSELNDGFMRPDYPEQVVHSYLQASLVFQMIEEEHGFEAIVAMLRGYRDGATTEDLFERVLGISILDFDDDFESYMDDRYRSALAGLVRTESPPGRGAEIAEVEAFVTAHPGDFVQRLRLGIMLFRDQRHEEAEPHLREALRIFPDYGGADSPYWFLAAIHRDRGEMEQAAAALARLTALSESNYAALLQHADLLEGLGRMEESADALDRAVQIWPYDPGLHIKLAELHTENGNHPQAVLERQAVVALEPADRAEALYLLARSQHLAGDARGARRSVMGALEIAPNYNDALEFLLEIRGTDGW